MSSHKDAVSAQLMTHEVVLGSIHPFMYGPMHTVMLRVAVALLPAAS
jgi:hypothetical protein